MKQRPCQPFWIKKPTQEWLWEGKNGPFQEKSAEDGLENPSQQTRSDSAKQGERKKMGRSGRQIEPQSGLTHLQGVAAGQGRLAFERLAIELRPVLALQVLRPPLGPLLPDAGVDARNGRVGSEVDLYRRAGVGAADDDNRPFGGLDPPLALILEVNLHRV